MKSKIRKITMTDKQSYSSNKNKSEVILYQTPDGKTKVDVRFEEENVWLTQKLLAELFGTTNKPFVHLTFLDAYTPSGEEAIYGLYSDYAEHYVDRSLGSVFASTDACLSNAFNFNISNWDPLSVGERGVGGHQWPRNWYKRSVTSTSPKFKYGFPLSLEGSGKGINKLLNELAKYPPGQQCELSTVFNNNPNCQRAACW